MEIKNFVKEMKNVPWQELKNWEFNELKNNDDRDVTKLKATIKEDGFTFPFIVWEEGKYVIDGAGRRLALEQLEEEGYKIKELPIVSIIAKDKKDAKKKALLISSSYGDITKRSLKNFIEELDIEELVNIEIGQKPIRVEDLVEQENKDDVIPEVEEEPQSKLGDIYILGKHRVMCGSSTNPEDMKALMEDEVADMVFTDPPYNVNYSGEGENTSNTILNDNMDKEDFDEFLDQVFRQMYEHTKKNAAFYVFHSTSTQAQFERAMNKNGMEVVNQLIWNKPTASMGWGHYRWKHEPFFYARKKGAQLEFFGDRTHTTILDFTKTEEELVKWVKQQKKLEQEGLTTIWTMKRDPVGEYIHPTQKPVELITYAIRNNSITNDIVLDQFGGSGSTLIACEKLGRQARLMELDPKYVDIIVKRWEEFTGEKAIKKQEI